jgi:hypothetical protein
MEFEGHFRRSGREWGLLRSHSSQRRPIRRENFESFVIEIILAEKN